MRDIILGKPIHWALWVVIVGVLYLADHIHMHVRWFAWFTGLVLALSTMVVLVILLTYRPGDRITREPFEDLEGTSKAGPFPED